MTGVYSVRPRELFGGLRWESSSPLVHSSIFSFDDKLLSSILCIGFCFIRECFLEYPRILHVTVLPPVGACDGGGQSDDGADTGPGPLLLLLLTYIELRLAMKGLGAMLVVG